MNIDLRRLRHALAVVEAGSFSAAAARLNLTQSALSRSIQSAENAIGIVLFERSSTGVRATEAGRAYLAAAAVLLQQARNLDALGKGLTSGEAGHVTIGLGSRVASSFLTKLLQGAIERHPRLALSIEIGDLEALLAGVKQERLDFAVFADTGDIISPVLVTERLAAMRACMLVRRDHPLAGKQRLERADLDDFTIAVGSLNFNAAEAIFGRSERLVLCDDVQVLRDLVLTTDVVWSTLVHAGDPQLIHGDLVELSRLSQDEDPSSLWLTLFRREDRTLSPAAWNLVHMTRHLIGSYASSTSSRTNVLVTAR